MWWLLVSFSLTWQLCLFSLTVFSLCDQHSPFSLSTRGGAFEISLAGKRPFLPEIELKTERPSLSCHFSKYPHRQNDLEALLLIILSSQMFTSNNFLLSARQGFWFFFQEGKGSEGWWLILRYVIQHCDKCLCRASFVKGTGERRYANWLVEDTQRY